MRSQHPHPSTYRPGMVFSSLEEQLLREHQDSYSSSVADIVAIIPLQNVHFSLDKFRRFDEGISRNGLRD